MPATTYGDITPRTAAFAIAKLLSRAMPHLVLEKFGQTYPLPERKTKIAKFRRYNKLALATTPLTEGVTPTGTVLTVTDVTATLQQYGDFVTITDVIQDTHEDPVLQQAQEVLAQQAAETVETIRYNILKAGTNVFYANGANRAAVNTPITLAHQRRVTRSLKAQNAKHITSIVRSTPSYETQNVEASYVAVCHSDVENDIRGMTGFINTKDYGQISPWENEIGAVEDVRYLRSTLFVPFADAGGLDGNVVLSTTGTNADVYPVLYFAQEAYGIVPLKGLKAITPMVVNPQPSKSDPLGQRGHVSWKTMQTAVILNDAWMARLEVAASV